MTRASRFEARSLVFLFLRSSLSVDRESEGDSGHDQLLAGVMVITLVDRRTSPNPLAEVDHLESNSKIQVLGCRKGALSPQVKTNWSFVVLP
jgi:hypothetical protein